MDPPTHHDLRLIRWLRAEMTRATGRHYQIKLELLDAASLRDIQRLLRDLDHEKQIAVRQAQLFPRFP